MQSTFMSRSLIDVIERALGPVLAPRIAWLISLMKNTLFWGTSQQNSFRVYWGTIFAASADV
jgi:hypothetical protein